MLDKGGGKMQVGSVQVTTTSGRGLTPEEWADRAVDRIIFVGDDKLYPSPIKDQAIAYREDIRNVIVHFMKNAIKSDRTTLYNLLMLQGEKEMAELLIKL